jgi:glucose/arabinose dehydrogenase
MASLVVAPADAAPALTTKTIAIGLSEPLFVTSSPDDPNRLFVLEKSGDIRVVDAATGQVLPQPFLSYADVSTEGEGGLLGLAFSPNYAQNGLFYTYRATDAGQVVVEGLQVSADPNVADPTSAHTILSVAHEGIYHFGGWLGFGPQDDNVYISIGDGLDFSAPQNKNSLLGKILRIDVTSDAFPADPTRNYAIPAANPFAEGGGAGEVLAYGLRNPWRIGFDRQTGDLYIGDVGENTIEEINLIPAGSDGGQNFGWPILEGDIPTGADPNGEELVAPLYQYTHQVGFAVTGGLVYRGSNIGGGVQGTYFFGDSITGQLWSFRLADGQVTEFQDRTQELQPPETTIVVPASFGEDALGRLYIADLLQGSILRIEAVPAAADPDRNGVVDLTDFGILKANFGLGTTWDQGDFNGDGKVDLTDFGVLKVNFGKDSGVAPATLAAPEPSTALLAALAAAGVLLERYRRRRPRRT